MRMGTSLGNDMRTIIDFEKQMDNVKDIMKKVTPDAAEAARSLASALRAGLNI